MLTVFAPWFFDSVVPGFFTACKANRLFGAAYRHARRLKKPFKDYSWCLFDASQLWHES
jgi:hypothetical protein